MSQFGYNLSEGNFSFKHKLFLQLFGLPFSWEKPNLVLKELSPQKGDLILDVGCRTGALISEVAARGAKVIGMDIDAEVIGSQIPTTRDYVKRINLVVSDICNSSIESDSVDKITIIDCLEHIENDRTAIQEIYRILKPKGSVIMTVPTIPGYPPHHFFTRIIPFLPRFLFRHVESDRLGKGRVVEFTGNDDGICLAETNPNDLLKAFGHYRHYDEKSLGDLLTSVGFTIHKMYRFQMLFESEMMHFHHSIKGFQSKYIWPLLKIISKLDCLLPKSYPGVGLLAVAVKNKPSERAK